MASPVQKIAACPHCLRQVVYWFSKNSYHLYRCSCGLGFVHPLPNPSEVYSTDYFSGAHEGFGYADYDRDKEVMVPTFREYIRRIKVLKPTGCLLDIGAATGFFLNIARMEGFQIEGVEISMFAAERAREKGIVMHTGTLETFRSIKQFDVITMLDLLEHVTDPQALLKRARDMMGAGGVLIINTPDFRSWYARMLGKGWHLIVPPEHLYYYTRPVLREMLDRADFEIVEMTTIGKKFTLPYIFTTLYKWLGLSIFASLSHMTERGVFARIGIPINLYDNVFIIARAK
ncbi:class I SAM-dependent methyltransferase [bacterium]|nr:class I SAM-dependent methyltransferase [bacterium]